MAMTVNASNENSGPTRNRKRYVLLAILLLALTIIAILWPVGKRAISLASRLRVLRQALNEDPLALILPDGRERLVSQLHGIQTDLGALQRYLAFPLTLTPHLNWVPYAGDTLSALPDMLEMAYDLSAAATTGAEVLAAFDILMTDSGEGNSLHGDTAQKLLGAIVAAQPQLRAAGDKIKEAMAARERFSDAELLSPLLAPLQQLDAYLPLLSAGMQALQHAPDLIGAAGPRTYLLVAQNSDELRATGGFISGIGVLTISEGAPGEISFHDSYVVEDWTQPHPDPPEPLRKYMLADLWTTRDANWWPDYPTSARAIQEMYALNQGVPTDGVVAVDMKALELIVGALEPLVLQEKAEEVTADNIREKIYEFWAPPPIEGPLPTDWREWSPEVRAWWAQRKDFMPMLTAAILERTQDVSSIDPGKLVYALKKGLEEKHILLYFDHPQMQQLLKENGWDAAVTPSNGDYLMVVDSNMGFNKANAAISQKVAYRVDLANEDGPLSEVVLSYRHGSKVQLEKCDKRAQYEPTYQGLIDRCYWDYVRLYAPPGSALLSIEGADEFELARQEKGKAVFAAYFVLPPGESRQITFRYLLPDTVLVKEESSTTAYLLQVQKQPGTLAIPLQIHIDLPPGMRAVHASPDPEVWGPKAIGYTSRLRVDRRFELALQPVD